MFSNYENTITGKALIGIAPNGMGLFFSDIYPGSISDNCIAGKSGVVQWLQPEHELMADRYHQKKTHPMWCNKRHYYTSDSL